MRKKLLQNTLFAMTAWAVYGLQANADTAVADARFASTMVALQR